MIASYIKRNIRSLVNKYTSNKSQVCEAPTSRIWTASPIGPVRSPTRPATSSASSGWLASTHHETPHFTVAKPSSRMDSPVTILQKPSVSLRRLAESYLHRASLPCNKPCLTRNAILVTSPIFILCSWTQDSRCQKQRLLSFSFLLSTLR